MLEITKNVILPSSYKLEKKKLERLSPLPRLWRLWDFNFSPSASGFAAPAASHICRHRRNLQHKSDQLRLLSSSFTIVLSSGSGAANPDAEGLKLKSQRRHSHGRGESRSQKNSSLWKLGKIKVVGYLKHVSRSDILQQQPLSVSMSIHNSAYPVRLSLTSQTVHPSKFRRASMQIPCVHANSVVRPSKFRPA